MRDCGVGMKGQARGPSHRWLHAKAQVSTGSATYEYSKRGDQADQILSVDFNPDGKEHTHIQHGRRQMSIDVAAMQLPGTYAGHPISPATDADSQASFRATRSMHTHHMHCIAFIPDEESLAD